MKLRIGLFRVLWGLPAPLFLGSVIAKTIGFQIVFGYIWFYFWFVFCISTAFVAVVTQPDKVAFAKLIGGVFLAMFVYFLIMTANPNIDNAEITANLQMACIVGIAGLLPFLLLPKIKF